MYTPIFHIGKILLILNCFSSNLNRNITELVIDTPSFLLCLCSQHLMVNIKNNKLNIIIKKLKNIRQLLNSPYIISV